MHERCHSTRTDRELENPTRYRCEEKVRQRIVAHPDRESHIRAHSHRIEVHQRICCDERQLRECQGLAYGQPVVDSIVEHRHKGLKSKERSSRYYTEFGTAHTFQFRNLTGKDPLSFSGTNKSSKS